MAHSHSPEPHPPHGDSWGELLELDAEVFGSYLSEALTRIEHHSSAPTRRVADIGAGTGAGSLAIARHFPTAEVVAIDSSTDLLARLRTAVEAQGLADQVVTLHADLDDGWPDAGAFDLVWASSSLHHVADADRLLRDVRSALNPGGLLAVLETDSQPFFLTDNVGGKPGLEHRLHRLMTTPHMNPHPDWTPHLQPAGFDLRERFTITTDGSSPAAGRYAFRYLSRARTTLDDRLTPADKATLDSLLVDGESIHPDFLKPSSSRNVWIAATQPQASAPLMKEITDEH